MPPFYPKPWTIEIVPNKTSVITSFGVHCVFKIIYKLIIFNLGKRFDFDYKCLDSLKRKNVIITHLDMNMKSSIDQLTIRHRIIGNWNIYCNIRLTTTIIEDVCVAQIVRGMHRALHKH